MKIAYIYPKADSPSDNKSWVYYHGTPSHEHPRPVTDLVWFIHHYHGSSVFSSTTQ